MVMPASCSGAMRTTWGSSQPLGVTPGQDRGFALAIAYRGYAGDCWRVTPPGAAMLPNPIPQPPRPDSAHWQACRRYPGLHGPKSACSLPAAEKVCGTAPVTLACTQATYPHAQNPSPRRRPGPQECATHLTSSTVTPDPSTGSGQPRSGIPLLLPPPAPPLPNGRIRAVSRKNVQI